MSKKSLYLYHEVETSKIIYFFLKTQILAQAQRKNLLNFPEKISDACLEKLLVPNEINFLLLLENTRNYLYFS